MLLTRPAFRRLCRARDRLLTLEEPLPSVGAIAQDVGLSPFQLIRQFEAVFGRTPHQFRTATRIDSAKRLLARGELSVTEICLEVGFTSLGSFSELFARRVGLSPSLYRRQVRVLVQVPDLADEVLAPGCLSLLALLPADAFRNSGEVLARSPVVPVAIPSRRETRR
jgi:AraC-like DNA-binding protein